MTALTIDETARYARHLVLKDFGITAQICLKKARVLVIGAGGLGCPALLYLAAAGVGTLEILDADTVDVSNLQRQILYTTADVGRLKVMAAAERLQALNPLIQIVPTAERLTHHNALERIAACDIVLDGSDNFATRYLVNDACVMLGKPFVYGAIHEFTGQASVFNWQGGATYRCLFPEPATNHVLPNCTQAGVLGVLPALIGTVQATEVIKLLTGMGESLSGRLLLWDALTLQTRTLHIIPDPNRQAIVALTPPVSEGCEPSHLHLTPTITATALKIQLHQQEHQEHQKIQIQLIDVRHDWERAAGTILPSLHIAWEHWQAANGTINSNSALFDALACLDRRQPTILFCSLGKRSQFALSILAQQYGFLNLQSLQGGYAAWQL